MGSVLQDNNRPYNTLLTFLLIVTNPGLIMLDHIHFQYNGMLLGILLCSIACMIRGTNHTMYDNTNEQVGEKEKRSEAKTCQSHQLWELGGAATFAALLAMKHLYLILAPLYFFYLLRHHCFIVKKISYKICVHTYLSTLQTFAKIKIRYRSLNKLSTYYYDSRNQPFPTNQASRSILPPPLGTKVPSHSNVPVHRF